MFGDQYLQFLALPQQRSNVKRILGYFDPTIFGTGSLVLVFFTSLFGFDACKSSSKLISKSIYAVDTTCSCVGLWRFSVICEYTNYHPQFQVELGVTVYHRLGPL